MSTSPASPRVDFAAGVILVDLLLGRHAAICDTIEQQLLNVKDKELSRSRKRDLFDRALTACVLGTPGITPALARLPAQLAAAHLADGFEPVATGDRSPQLDPLELIVRAYLQWEQTRWPGRSARLAYADSIFCVYLLRQLEHLSLRIWDDGYELAEARLREVQRLLDRLNAASTVTLVRDARWLMQTAQGPLTRLLRPYFDVAAHVAASLPESYRLPLHGAGAKLAGGHLRSQLRYRSWEENLPIDDPQVMATTRNSNAMDVALLVGDLVPLLAAYDATLTETDDNRLELADAILQGLAADPELLVTRLDLLGPYATIEELAVEPDEHGHPRATSFAHRQRGLLDRYHDLIGRTAAALRTDAAALAAAAGTYSPFGIAYGFCADLLGNMAIGPLHAQASSSLSLEDVFGSRGRPEEKTARAAGWSTLPTRSGEREHFYHAPEWAGAMLARLESALDARAAHPAEPNASGRRSGRLFVVARSSTAVPGAAARPETAVDAQEHCLTSDLPHALATGATAFQKSQLTADRNEARFLASANVDGQFFGVSKVLLTACTAAGHDAIITDVPALVVNTLRLTYPGLIELTATTQRSSSGS